MPFLIGHRAEEPDCYGAVLLGHPSPFTQGELNRVIGAGYPLAALVLVALGVALEYGRLFSVGRFFEIGDMAANAVGVCLSAGRG